jgi:hypothetical protein
LSVVRLKVLIRVLVASLLWSAPPLSPIASGIDSAASARSGSGAVRPGPLPPAPTASRPIARAQASAARPALLLHATVPASRIVFKANENNRFTPVSCNVAASACVSTRSGRGPPSFGFPLSS